MKLQSKDLTNILAFQVKPPANEIDRMKFRVRERLLAGKPMKESLAYGVKYIEKLVDKLIAKEKQLFREKVQNILIKSFAIDKEFLLDPMEMLNEIVHNAEETHG